MTARFATIGNLCIDDLVFADGSTQWRVPGGNAMYSGLGVAVWDPRPSIVAPIGPDYPIEVLAGNLDVSYCPQIPRTLRNWGLYEDDGTRHFVFRSQTRRWLDFSPRPQDVEGLGAAAAHLAPLPWDLHVELIGTLRRSGTHTISIDLDDRNLAGIHHASVADLVASVELFLPSRQDALAMFPESDPVDALRRLRDMAPETPLIAVKCGPDGCIAHAAGQREMMRVPAVPVVVADATGAGDAFCGGALVGFVNRESPVDAVLHGAVSASFCVEGLGCSGLLRATPNLAHDRLTALREAVDFRAF